jgi:hypothetical protein
MGTIWNRDLLTNPAKPHQPKRSLEERITELERQVADLTCNSGDASNAEARIKLMSALQAAISQVTESNLRAAMITHFRRVERLLGYSPGSWRAEPDQRAEFRWFENVHISTKERSAT